MLKKIKYMALCSIIALMGCSQEKGPQGTLDDLANAMDSYNPSQFLSKIDMQAFASNHIKNLTRESNALSSLNALGNMLGFGPLDNLIGDFINVKAQITAEMDRGVSSGELMIQCRKSEVPNCPWVPQSLRDAHVVEVAPGAAIARVTTPMRLNSWLALRRVNGQWKVVGQAVLEQNARDYALESGQANQQPPQQKNAAPKKI